MTIARHDTLIIQNGVPGLRHERHVENLDLPHPIRWSRAGYVGEPQLQASRLNHRHTQRNDLGRIIRNLNLETMQKRAQQRLYLQLRKRLAYALVRTLEKAEDLTPRSWATAYWAVVCGTGMALRNTCFAIGPTRGHEFCGVWAEDVRCSV